MNAIKELRLGRCTRHLYAVSAILLAAFFSAAVPAIGLGIIYILDLIFEMKAIGKKKKKKAKQKSNREKKENIGKIPREILNKISFDEDLTVVDLFEPDYEFESEKPYQSATLLLINENKISTKKDAPVTIEVTTDDLITSVPRTPYGDDGDVFQGIQKTQEGSVDDLLQGIQKTQEGSVDDLLQSIQKTQEGSVEKRNCALTKRKYTNATAEGWEEAIQLYRLKSLNLYDERTGVGEHEKTPVYPKSLTDNAEKE